MRRRFAIAGFLAVGLGIVAVLLIFDKSVSLPMVFRRVESPLSASAENILRTCRDAPHTLSCYDAEIPKLLNTLTMEDAFALTRLIQQRDPRYLNCHVLAHYIAERETAKNPDRWEDVVARCPVMMCNNGCPHGSLMERFKNEEDYLTEEQIQSIKPDLADVCEARGGRRPEEVERSMCYHGLGHLAMYITNANLKRSAALCRDIAIKKDGNYVQTCVEGVFMSVFQPLGPEDIALVQDITPRKESVTAFCEPFAEDTISFHACRKESWALFYDDITTATGLAAFCSYTDDRQWQWSCYMSLMNPNTDALVIRNRDIAGLQNLCAGLPGAFRGTCFAGAAHRLLQVDAALLDRTFEICAAARDVGTKEQNDCFRAISAFAVEGFALSNRTFATYCRRLPPPWDNRCLMQKR